MKNPFVIICGPTATGKTALSLKLCQEFNGEIISADSRQIYKDMNIGTGKDLPLNLKFKTGYYLFDQIPVWMLDIVNPDQKFSVAEYVEFAQKIIKDIWQRGKIPFLVGGTGFYIKALIDGVKTLGIPQNLELRKKLKDKSTEELQNILREKDFARFAKMNKSDRYNPRRLIRAIEVTLSATSTNKVNDLSNISPLFLGLITDQDNLKNRISKRVDKMIQSGLEKEVRQLISRGLSFDLPSMSAVGYQEWRPYLAGGKINLTEVIQRIKNNTFSYAKRQITWFKKDKRILWFDINNSSCYDKLKASIYEYAKN